MENREPFGRVGLEGIDITAWQIPIPTVPENAWRENSSSIKT